MLRILAVVFLTVVSIGSSTEALADDSLERFYAENAGKTVRRLPTWICPENAFVMIHGESLKPGAENANAALMEMLAEKGTYNFVTLTLRCHPELGDAETEREVKKVVDVAHRHGIGVGMDLDPRIARREFLRRWPDEAQHLIVVAKGETYASGRAQATVSARNHSDHMSAGAAMGYDPISVSPLAGYAVRFARDAVVPGSVRKVPLKTVANSTFRMVVEAEGLAADETLVALGDFRLFSCDVFSNHLIPFTRELMERYKALGADAAMRDEWGFPSPDEDGFHDGRCFWYSPGYADAYAKRTGRNLEDDFIVMAYPAKGDDSLRHRLAGEYMYLNFERNAEIEEDMYATSKRLWGEDCYVTKHPTWYGQLEYHNIWHDGMDWWRAKRDWAQSDEVVPRCALLGMMRKFGGPNWLNEWYSGTPASYHTNIWRYAVAGARMVVHPLFDPQPFKMFPNDPDRANRYYHEPILTPDFVRAEGRIRLLNLMTRGQVASQAAVVFGHKRTINFADKATWLPGESDLGIKNWRTIDWGGGLAADFWKTGYFADLFPSDEFSYGTFTVDADGYLRVGTQAYPVVVFTHLDVDDVAAFRQLTDGKALKTKVFAWDADGLPNATVLAKNEATEAIAYLDATGAIRQPVAVGKRESWSKAWQGDILPLGDGTTTLTDGTVQRVKGAVNDIAGDDIAGTIDLGNAKVEYVAKGVFAARADKDGRLAGLAAGGATRIKGLGIDLALEKPEDFALYRLSDGKMAGVWQTADGAAEIPAGLKHLAESWTKLILPNQRGNDSLAFGAPFQDGAILQRDCPVPVWGTAAADAIVEVSFAGQEKKAKAAADGRWRVTLDPLSASSDGRELKIKVAGSQESKLVSDILVGEVWLCSGQSNMEMSFANGYMRYGDGIGRMVAQVTDKPFVRYMKSPGTEGWHSLSSKFLMSGWRSALPVHYALELHDKLGIPVGVIVAAVGGSSIDSWNPDNGEKAKLHSSRIVPLGPFALRGAIWYQGETNVKEVNDYPRKLTALHTGWKTQFENPSLPLDIVQLAPFNYGTPEEREALPQFMENQARYASERPDATITIVNDIGNFYDIHPNNKWLVAKRLALHAFRRDYGFSDIEDESPALVSATVVATNRVRLVFNHANELYVYRPDMSRGLFAEFEMAGTDGIWRKADIVNFPRLDWTRQGCLTNNVIELVANGIAKPIRVRHAYVEPFTGCLYNQVNLPCGPFCADVADAVTGGEK